jgi:farnesyl-diphosphate farnesyltransferase
MDAATSRAELLGSLLENVSRSFYLTLRVLPEGVRDPIGLAYLLARAADTIADTELVEPARRLDFLLAFREQVNSDHLNEARVRSIESALTAHQKDKDERVLLQSLVPALRLLKEMPPKDLAEVRAVVTTLTRGMEMDLVQFPPENAGQLGSLKTQDELETYTYFVAGCVGEFWTKMTVAHTRALKTWDVREMSECGIRFGKALQYTNILRDVPKDLRIGRCYLPKDLLAAHGLTPNDLIDATNGERAKPVLFTLLRIALEHYHEALRYTLAIPLQLGRLRLACLWPILIGLPTLSKTARNPQWLEPGKASKVSRGFVKRTVALSFPVVGSDYLVRAWMESHMRDVERALNAHPRAN